MFRIRRKAALAVLLFAGAFGARAAVVGGPSTTAGEWLTYGGDLANTRYSPLNADRRWELQQARAGVAFPNRQSRSAAGVQARGHAAHGRRHALRDRRDAPRRRRARCRHRRAALGAWRRRGRARAAGPRLLSGRGLSYWSDGKEARVLYITIGYQLVALDARTGSRVSGFGRDGRVDLKEPVIIGGGQKIEPVTGEIGVNNTPLIVGDVVVVGSAFSEQSGTLPTTHNNSKGLVHAYDIRSGKRLWIFRTIPMPGEFGNETWENDSWAVNGNNGVWTQMAADPELGLVYLPIETPTSDYYGGHRPGNNLFAESVVAVDVKTGKRKWHFQLVHHPLWGFDNASPPILADIVVGGKTDQGARAAGQAGVPVRLRSRVRRAGMADRGAAGAERATSPASGTRRRSRFRHGRPRTTGRGIQTTI